MKKTHLKARLVLEDGSEYQGLSCGKALSRPGEVVFTTGMAGYPEALSDPSFSGQILCLTYPLCGNYGVPVLSFDQFGIPRNFESERVQISGLVVQNICEEPSHHSSGGTLSAWLEKNDVPAISGIDTRALTQKLRERGVMRGKILVEGRQTLIDSGADENLVAKVSTPDVKIYQAENKPSALKIALVDCGVKANILRSLLGRGASVIRVPWDYDITKVDCDGIFLSNGPGDPKACGKTIASVRRAFTLGKPIFGVCLGNQIMALAAGADTYKLPYGHRAQNQPCIQCGTERCYITSQNHGYAVRGESLPQGWEAWFVNANDGTIEGIRSKSAPFSAVQFHPEGCPGPRDTEFLIDGFLRDVKNHAEGL